MEGKAMNPIIVSRLDNDFYQWTMSQLAWRHFAGVNVSYQLINRRPSIKLAELIDMDELHAQIEQARQLRYTEAEIGYLRELGLFEPAYLDFLASFQLPAITLSNQGGQLALRYSGPWAAAVFWETPLLAIVNELYHRARPGEGRLLALPRLEDKMARLGKEPAVRFTEFGSRRRYSRAWQAEVTRRLQATLPQQLLGTSNLALAKELGLSPSGTMAHQLFMVTAALRVEQGDPDPIFTAQEEVLERWEADYHDWRDGALLTALPDTFGTANFLDHFGNRAKRWHWLRQDSGRPEQFMEQLFLPFCRRHQLNLGVIFSDGLTVEDMIKLARLYGQSVPVRFGWGTNLTNDAGEPPLPLVIKPYEANGQPAVKLSDDADKASGPASAVALYRRLASRQHVA
jgi:nicotinate phosphoribosyltransferase